MHFVDVLVIALVMMAITWFGHRLSGSISSRRGLFQADGSLPWWAVSASILATLVSAVTFVSVPAAVFAPGGDLTYFQVVLGLALGKVAVAALLARPYYLSTGVDTCYQYIGGRLDAPSGEFSMYLGLLLNLINSGVKLLTASLVLDVITGWGIPGCALVVVMVSILWSALAGIKTVIWTDLLLFIFFSIGAVFVLLFTAGLVELSFVAAWAWLDEQAKLVLFDFSTDTSRSYTIWAGVIGGITLNIAQGCTQGTWQRVRSCRSADDAHKAFSLAALFYVMHVVILAVGLALAVFYSLQPLPAEMSLEMRDAPDRIFPYFILTEIPVGLSGLFIAAIFAAAISTLDSALTETADMTLTHIYARHIYNRGSEAHYVAASRWLMVFWGLVFMALALFFNRYSAEGLLNLTFKLPNYVYGTLFGVIVLARFRVGRFTTILIGALLATGLTVAMSRAGIAFFYWCPVAGSTMVLVVWLLERAAGRGAPEWLGVLVATNPGQGGPSS
ncbi:MAG: hypothetical protein AAF513_00210 [Pseudomonadota bacterium]